MFAGKPSICSRVNGKSRSRSLLATLALWLFIVAIVGDAVNLDDLLSPAIVVHGDEEVVSAGAELPDASDASNGAGVHLSTILSSIHQYTPPPHSFVRVVIDQDSPSLEANIHQAFSKDFRILTDSPAFSSEVPPPTGLLHLLFHSLLI